MNVKGLKAYQVKKNLKKLEESLRNQDWSEIRVFWERKQRSIERERSKEMSLDRRRGLYSAGSKSRQMQVSRAIEVFVE